MEDLGVPITYERLRALEEVIDATEGPLCEEPQIAHGSTSTARNDCEYDSDNESRTFKCSWTSLFDRISEEIFKMTPMMSSALVYDEEDAVSLGSDFDREVAELAGFYNWQVASASHTVHTLICDAPVLHACYIESVCNNVTR